MYEAPGLIFSGEAPDMAVAQDGSIWVASFGGGVGHYQGSEWDNYSKNEGLVSDSFWSIVIGPDNSVWIGSWNEGSIMKFDGSDWKTYGEDLGLISGGYIWSLTSSKDGKIWAGTSNGIAKFDGNRWEMLTPAGDSSLNDVRSIVVDQQDNVWIGTYTYETGGKVVQLNDGKWRVYGSEDGLIAGDAVMALEISPNGVLFAGTYNGLYWLINDHWELVEGTPGFVNDIAFSPDGSFWIATEFDGIMEYNKDLVLKSSYHLGEGLPGFRLYSIDIDSDGTVWVGGEGGVVSISPKSGPQISDTTIDCTPSTHCYEVEVSAKTLWLGTKIWVSKGDYIVIEYVSGKWRAGSDYSLNWTDANGYPGIQPSVYCSWCTAPMLEGTLGQLVAKIEEQKAVHIIGNGGDFWAEANGVLCLMMNDIYYSFDDNSGSVTVRIWVNPQ